MRIIPGTASVIVTDDIVDVNNLRISLVWETMQHNDVCTKIITVGIHRNADCLLYNMSNKHYKYVVNETKSSILRTLGQNGQ
jgi:hypothetical protein